MSAEMIVATVFVFIGIAMFIGHVAFQRGTYRSIARNYDNPVAPDFVRRTPFALLPMGLGALLIGSFSIVSEIFGPSDELLIVFVGALTVVGPWMMWRLHREPPDRLKPAWMLSHEEPSK